MSLLSPQLEAFLEIVRAGTVHGAAEAIGITQTGVTQRLRALEKQLSVTLFIRSRRGMGLTGEGDALYRYCQAALELEGQAMAQITGSAGKRAVQVHIVGPTSLMSSRIVPQCRPVMERFPNLLMRFQVADEPNRIDYLRSGQAQFAVLTPEQVAREMHSKRLEPERYVLVGAPAWRGRSLNDILTTERLIDFDPSDQTSLSYLKTFDLYRSDSGSERHFVNNNDALIHLFHAGAGFGVLMQEIAAPHLARGDIILLNDGAVFESEAVLAWYPRPRMTEYFQALVRAII